MQDCEMLYRCISTKAFDAMCIAVASVVGSGEGSMWLECVGQVWVNDRTRVGNSGLRRAGGGVRSCKRFDNGGNCRNHAVVGLLLLAAFGNDGMSEPLGRAEGHSSEIDEHVRITEVCCRVWQIVDMSECRNPTDGRGGIIITYQ